MHVKKLAFQISEETMIDYSIYFGISGREQCLKRLLNL